MSRYLIQSAETFQFLHFNPVRGQIDWTSSLVAALRNGVMRDIEQVQEMIEDHADRSVIVVDLDEDRVG